MGASGRQGVVVAVGLVQDAVGYGRRRGVAVPAVAAFVGRGERGRVAVRRVVA